jgi:hypothetical protein
MAEIGLHTLRGVVVRSLIFIINENLSSCASLKNPSFKNAQKSLTEAGLRPIMLSL